MKEKEVGQRELSRLTNIRQATLSAYCNNSYKQISKEHLDVLCSFFSCRIEELVEFVKDENN